jgi:hypothetical protein
MTECHDLASLHTNSTHWLDAADTRQRDYDKTKNSSHMHDIEI